MTITESMSRHAFNQFPQMTEVLVEVWSPQLDQKQKEICKWFIISCGGSSVRHVKVMPSWKLKGIFCHHYFPNINGKWDNESNTSGSWGKYTLQLRAFSISALSLLLYVFYWAFLENIFPFFLFSHSKILILKTTSFCLTLCDLLKSVAELSSKHIQTCSYYFMDCHQFAHTPTVQTPVHLSLHVCISSGWRRLMHIAS